jgi:hypothetical protein
MSTLLQLLSMLAIPAALLLTCRFLNLRGDRDATVPPGARKTDSPTHIGEQAAIALGR